MDERVVELVESRMAELDVSVESLAASVGLARVTLRRRLKEGSSFTLSELDRIAGALDCDVHDLIPPRRFKARKPKPRRVS